MKIGRGKGGQLTIYHAGEGIASHMQGGHESSDRVLAEEGNEAETSDIPRLKKAIARTVSGPGKKDGKGEKGKSAVGG